MRRRPNDFFGLKVHLISLLLLSKLLHCDLKCSSFFLSGGKKENCILRMSPVLVIYFLHLHYSGVDKLAATATSSSEVRVLA